MNLEHTIAFCWSEEWLFRLSSCFITEITWEFKGTKTVEFSHHRVTGQQGVQVQKQSSFPFIVMKLFDIPLKVKHVLLQRMGHLAEVALLLPEETNENPLSLSQIAKASPLRTLTLCNPLIKERRILAGTLETILVYHHPAPADLKCHKFHNSSPGNDNRKECKEAQRKKIDK